MFRLKKLTGFWPLALFCFAAPLWSQTVAYEYTHDSAGQLIQVVDSTGVVLQYNYDAAGNIKSITRSAISATTILFSPSQGGPGSIVYIQGLGFSATPANNVVTFNGVAATVVAASPNALTVNVPNTAATGPIRVTVGATTYTSPTNFTVLPIPVISSVNTSYTLPGATPYAITGDTLSLTVTGVNLAGATFAFSPAPVPAAITVNSANVNGAGTSAILNLATNTSSGSFVLVATNAAGSSNPFSSAGNTLVVLQAGLDQDGDGLSNAQEKAHGTDPFNIDSDHDGMPDAWELLYNLNPLDSSDAAKLSGDGHSNLYEYQNGLDPTNPDRTVPAVISTTPAAGSANQPPNGSIVVVFSKPVLSAAQIAPLTKVLSKVSPGNVTLTSGGLAVPGSFALSPDGTQLTFTPTLNLKTLTAYSLTVTGFRSQSGVSMAANFTLGFQTNNVPDTTPPKVIRTSPASGDTNVAINSTISLEFSKPIDLTTVTTVTNSASPNFLVLDSLTGVIIAGRVLSDSTGRILTFVSAGSLPVGRTIEVEVNLVNPGAPSIKDTAGNPATAYLVSFVTSFNSGTQPLAVRGSSPLNGDTGIPANTQLVLSFSQSVDEIAAVHGIQITQNGNPIVGTFTFVNNDQMVSFTPAVNISPGVVYPFSPGVVTVTVPASVTDVAGNPLATPYSFSFTVDSPVDTTAPKVLAINPPTGATSVGGNIAALGFAFDKRLDPVTTAPMLELRDSNTYNPVAGTTTVSADRKSITFQPSAILPANTRYCLFFNQTYLGLYMGPGDLAGNSIFTQTCFTTGLAADTAAPAVTGVNPPNGSTGVPLNAVVVVQMSETINGLSFNSNSLAVKAGGVAVGGTAALSADQTSISFTPSAAEGFAANTVFSASLSGVTDVAGNPAAPFASAFTTGTITDTTPPMVSSVPADQATGVPTNSNVVLTFDKPINPVTVNASTIVVTQQPSGIVIDGSYVLNSSGPGGVVTFTPSSLMPSGSTINLLVNGVQDFAGNGNASYSITFITAATADTTPPTVTSVTPTDGSTGLGLNTVVNLSFSKPLDPTTINTTTVGLFKGATRILSSTIANSLDCRTVSLTANLDNSATYTVVVTSGVQDLSGNHLADFRSAFTTAAANAAGPSVVTMRPANGSRFVTAPDSIVLYVNKPLNSATVNGALRVVDFSGSIVPGTTQVSGGGQTIVFTPSAPFQPLGVYVYLDSTATDLAGDPAFAYQAQFFFTSSNAASAPPYLTTFSWTGIQPTNAVFDIGFSKPLDPSTVNSTNFSMGLLYGPGGNTIPVNVSLYNDHVVRVTPQSPLTPNTNYSISSTTNVKDTDGLSLATALFGTFSTTTGPDHSQPRVATVTPPDGSLNVGDNAPVYLHFTKAIDPTTVSSSTVQISSAGKAIAPFSISFSDNNQTVVFTPLTALPDNAAVSISVGGIEDSAANSILPFTSSFTTRNGPALSNANVQFTNPPNGAAGVPINSALTLQFDIPVDPTTVNATNLSVMDSVTGQPVAGVWQLSSNALQVSFAPTAAFAVGRSYSLTWGNSVHDLAGNFLNAGNLAFTTTFQPSTTPPTVTLSSPEDGQTSVPINAEIQIQFSAPVASASIQDVALIANGNAVGSLLRTLSAGNTVLTLTPPTLLLSNANYGINITGVKDLAGNAISPVTRGFTTGPGAVLTSLSVVGTNPPRATNGNISNIGTNVTITASFNQRLNPLTANASSMVLYDYTDSLIVQGTVSLSADRKSVTFTPSAPLNNNTFFQWSVNGVQDQIGNGASAGGTFITGLTADHAAPTITAVSPPNHAQNVAVNVIPGFLMIEPVNALTVSNASVSLKTGNSAVAGKVTLQADLQTIVFQPAGLLAPGATYTATVTGIADFEGNVMAPYTSSFTTSPDAAPDTTPPTVLTSNPSDGAQGVPTNSPIVLTFSENIDPLTVNGTTVPVTLQSNGYHIAGAYSVDNSTANGQITFTPSPSSSIPPGSSIGVTINGVADYAGNPSDGFSFAFTTAGGADQAPTVTSVTPPDLTTGVGLYPAVTLTFSKSLDLSTVTNTSVALFAGSARVNANANLSISQDGTAITLGPGPVALPPDTVITVVATSDVADLAGTPLAAFSSRFTTGAAANGGSPRVMSQRPQDGSTGVPLNSQFVLFFSAPMDPASTRAAFHVAQNGVLVAGNAVLSEGNQLLTFTPSGPYAAGALIQVFLNSNATGANGLTTQVNYSWSYTTLADTTGIPPSPIGTTLDSANGISLNPVIDVLYNKPLAAFDATQVFLEAYPDLVPLNVKVSLWNSTTLHIVPAAPLPPNTEFRCVINYGAVSDSQGNPSTGVTRVFVTGPGPVDTAQPRVSFITPSTQSQGVPVNAPIYVRFSKAMNFLTVSPTTVAVTINSVPVPGLFFSFHLQEDLQDLYVYPYSPLPDNAAVTVSVSGLEDLSGNVVIPSSSSFHTGSGVDFVAPTVVRTSPAQGSSNVPVNSVVTLELSKPIDSSTVNADSVQLVDESGGSNTPLPGTYSVAPNGLAITFAPAANLAPGDTFVAGWGSFNQVTDLAGNPLVSGGVSFTTSGLPVNTPPQVLAIDPASGFTNVATNVVPHILFDRPLNGTTLGGITLKAGATPVNIVPGLSNGNRTLSLMPPSLLAASTAYTLTLSGVADVAGNVLAAPLTITFTTGAGADLDSPQVSGGSPASGDSNVSSGLVTATVTFNEPIDPASVITTTCYISDSSSNRVPSTLGLSADGLTLTYTLGAPLAANSGYQIALSVTDLAGNTLVAYIPFTTGN